MRWLALLLLSLPALARTPAAQTVSLPSLHGLPCEVAKGKVEALGLGFRVDPPNGPARPYDPTKDQGREVQDQQPQSGEVSPGTIVSVVLVIPPEPGTWLLVILVLALAALIAILLRRAALKSKRTPPPA